MRYVAPEINAVTRQRQVVLTVPQPYTSTRTLLPNQQVKVHLQLGEQSNIVQLPLSSITRDGYVWTVNAQSQLQKEWIEPIEQQGNIAYIRFRQQPDQTRKVILYPLSSMLVGKEVDAQLDTQTASNQAVAR